MRPKALSAVMLFIVATSLTSFSQQTDIPMFSAYTAFSYLSTPSLNLTQRGFDGDFGVNIFSWLTVGGDFSYNGGHSTLYPNDLVLTGTPAGVGPLAANDVVEVEVVGHSQVRSPVVALS